ncbi:MAG: carbon monoxide dehydrogenase, partial [Chloroflexi bacterium]|nr:carbon monoxide dehydrogenase [Chloroflexota bacterium]
RAGAVLFPMVLPWLPTRDFSSKGFVLGGLVGLPFAIAALLGAPGPTWSTAILALAYLLLMSPVTAYLALNFTGSTPFTSRSAVAREISTYIRPMAGIGGAGAVLGIAGAAIRLLGGL